MEMGIRFPSQPYEPGFEVTAGLSALFVALSTSHVITPRKWSQRGTEFVVHKSLACWKAYTGYSNMLLVSNVVQTNSWNYMLFFRLFLNQCHWSQHLLRLPHPVCPLHCITVLLNCSLGTVVTLSSSSVTYCKTAEVQNVARLDQQNRLWILGVCFHSWLYKCHQAALSCAPLDRLAFLNDDAFAGQRTSSFRSSHTLSVVCRSFSLLCLLCT